jgi:hypothetical protein
VQNRYERSMGAEPVPEKTELTRAPEGVPSVVRPAKSKLRRLNELASADAGAAALLLIPLSGTGIWKGGIYGVLGVVGLVIAVGCKVWQYAVKLDLPEQ